MDLPQTRYLPTPNQATVVDKNIRREMMVPCLNCGRYMGLTDSLCAYCGCRQHNALIDAQQERRKQTGSNHVSATAATLIEVDKPPQLQLGEVALYLGTSQEFAILPYTKPLLLGRGKQVRSPAAHFLNLGAHDGYMLGMSRNHALIQRVDTAYDIIDLGSANGVMVNGQPLVPNRAHRLGNGVTVHLGKFPFVFFYADW